MGVWLLGTNSFSVAPIPCSLVSLVGEMRHLTLAASLGCKNLQRMRIGSSDHHFSTISPASFQRRGVRLQALIGGISENTTVVSQCAECLRDKMRYVRRIDGVTVVGGLATRQSSGPSLPDEITGKAGADHGTPPGGVSRLLVGRDTEFFENNGLVLALLRCSVVGDPCRAPCYDVTAHSPLFSGGAVSKLRYRYVR